MEAVPVQVAGTSSASPVQLPLRSVHPSGQAPVLSVDASRSQMGVYADVSMHPAGQSPVPSVVVSRSQVGVRSGT